MASFQKDPNYRSFLISLKADGYGLNLTAADPRELLAEAKGRTSTGRLDLHTQTAPPPKFEYWTGNSNIPPYPMPRWQPLRKLTNLKQIT